LFISNGRILYIVHIVINNFLATVKVTTVLFTSFASNLIKFLLTADKTTFSLAKFDLLMRNEFFATVTIICENDAHVDCLGDYSDLRNALAASQHSSHPFLEQCWQRLGSKTMTSSSRVGQK